MISIFVYVFNALYKLLNAVKKMKSEILFSASLQEFTYKVFLVLLFEWLMSYFIQWGLFPMSACVSRLI